ncbi:hypothetical protein P152DRAFT_484413 [Eremomyces bilateralis CBS 781.70]|uniref:Alpha/beta-hydrolase n=1 Tax=Eremomyces bilateralis CBS 781.70 TaxID=1392243 RepID=A0A6G1FVS4_9PEZI|nr:uncharacterized protein P152DRAFT_484413 [Eremomyces bilateralis CBS 781.70]KAF1809806.1 hypothetical protein P152DRAFT_484413 [Eremomyces bilateralis CBS 781.70]
MPCCNPTITNPPTWVCHRSRSSSVVVIRNCIVILFGFLAVPRPASRRWLLPLRPHPVHWVPSVDQGRPCHRPDLQDFAHPQRLEQRHSPPNPDFSHIPLFSRLSSPRLRWSPVDPLSQRTKKSRYDAHLCRWSVRGYASLTTATDITGRGTGCEVEEVDVPGASSGSIPIQIYHPRSLSGLGAPYRRAILYFPALPYDVLSVPGLTNDIDARDAALLCEQTGIPVIQIKYRLNSVDRYPRPIHDVFAAFDWVSQNLEQLSKRSHLRSDEDSDEFSNGDRKWRNSSLRLATYGRLVGAQLATTLGLIECRMTSGTPSIVATAVDDAVVDWTFPQSDISYFANDSSIPAGANSGFDITDDDLNRQWDELLSLESGSLVDEVGGAVIQEPQVTRKRRKKRKLPSWENFPNGGPLSTSTLLDLRDQLFRRPSQTLDPFASPLFFFRSSGIAIPEPGTVITSTSSDPTVPFGDPSTALPYHNRKSHMVYPPTGSGLRLPDFSITASGTSPLRDQAEELAKLLRRSVTRSEVKRMKTGRGLVDDVLDDGTILNHAVMKAEKRVLLDVRERPQGLGRDETLLVEKAAWLKNVLTAA